MLGPLLEIEMSKKCTPLWHEAHFEVKMYKTHQLRTTFGSWDVEKLHVVCQNVQNTTCSDHFWKLRCRKSARRCGAKHMSKSKCLKHHMFGPLLGSCDVEILHVVAARSTISKSKCEKHTCSDHFWRFRCRFAWQAQGIVHRVKSQQNVKIFWLFNCNHHYTSLPSNTLHYNYTFTTFHYTTLHSTTRHYIQVHHYTTLHSSTFNYTTLHYTTLHNIPTTLHYITLHSTTLHYITLHYIPLDYITLHYTPLHCTTTTLHYTTFHYTTLHSTTLHYISLHYITNYTTPQLQLHYTTLHHIPLQSTKLHLVALHYITLHYTTFHLHYTRHYANCITPHYTTLHYTLHTTHYTLHYHTLR